MQADVAWANPAPCKIRHDEGYVPGARDHRMLLIYGTLARVSTGMGVNVGDDAHSVLVAMFAKSVVTDAVKVNAARQTFRIEIIVEKEFGHDRAILVRSEQECAALAPTVPALVEGMEQ
jgi:hypothetical protein